MAYRRSLDFLPNVFRTEVNDKFLHATVDQLISEPELKRIDGYVGRRFSPVAGSNDSFINEITESRQDYQLEPHTTFVDKDSRVKFTAGYIDLLRRIEALGGFTNDHSRLFSDNAYNYDGFIDYDKFLNYSSYYWLPNGPDAVTVFATGIPLQQDFNVIPPVLYQIANGIYENENFDVKGYDVSENSIIRVREDGIKFNVTGTKINPTIRLARGGVYKFNVDQIGHGFFIQTQPGTTDQLSWQNNLSSRDVYGVENNGEDVGVITFKVPEITAQDFFDRMTIFGSANLAAHSVRRNRSLRYSDLHNKKYDDVIAAFGGIDGQLMLEGKTLVFLRDPVIGKNPQPWNRFTTFEEGDLLQYGNTVYRVLQTFTTGSEFNDSKLELYDLQQSWYNPDPFDTRERPYDSVGFDIGEAVAFEDRRSIFKINIDDEGYIKLTPGLAIPRNNKVSILEGIAYGNKSLYRDSNDDILLVNPTTATLNKLYYADSLDPNIGGTIEIVDQDNNLKIDVLGSILYNTSYESPNGVRFTNGLKIKFLQDVIQPEYAGKTYYVEGVGKSIKLIDADDLLANETWLDTIESPFDIVSFDNESFSASTNSPLKPDYFVINRSSIEKSGWARHNRWFHNDIIELTSKYNNFTTVVDSNYRAKRPILEFDPNLQLYNFGQIAKKAVDAIDRTTLDALSFVEGQPVTVNDSNVVYFTGSASSVAEFKNEKETEGYTVVRETVNSDGVVTIQMKLEGLGGYYVDDIPLFPGMRIIFTADRDPDVRNKIYEVQWIRPQSETDDRVWSFTIDGSTTSFDLNYNVAEPSRLQVFVNGVDASSQGYYWSYLLSTQSIVFSNTMPPVDSNLTVSLEYNDQIHLVLADDGDVEEGDCVYVQRGKNNQGKMFHFTNGTWIETQQKTGINQAPRFDLFNQDRKSFGDTSIYPSNDFIGNKLFGYELGTGSVDPILGIKLKYRNINNIGDIVFSDFIAKGNVTYRSGQKSIVQSTLGGKVKINDENRSFYFRNQWRKIREKSKQNQLQTYYATDYQKNLFRLNVLPDGIKNTTFTNIVVYINNRLLYNNNYDIQIEDNISYLALNKDLNVGDKLDIKIYSSEVNAGSIFEVPDNFTNNPFNKEITDITLGQMRNHIIRCIEDIPNLSDAPLSEYNLRDTQDVKTFRGSILQHDGATHFANFLLNDTEANFTNSVINAQREYVRFKNRLLQLAGEVAVVGENASQTLERVMSEIVANKNKNFAYFTSDMLPFGNDYNKRTYTVYDIRLSTYDLSDMFELTKPTNRAVLVYLNNQQLLYNRDYTFSYDRPILELNLDSVTLNENDVIEIREYTTTDGSYIPPTPSKMGLYPLFVPAIVQDGNNENLRQMIRGHDGSLTAMFGDSRDAVLIEFETRIYNNVKTTYNVNRFDVWAYIPGAFRKTAYNLDEFNSILSSHFSAWSGSNAIAVSDYRQYVANDSFTYNYSRFTNKVDGKLMPASSWRGLYRYYYDTDAPHLRPWEMLGFVEKPTWWELSYGPAPYTSGNTVLWGDIEAGRILYGERAGIDAKFARPGLSNILPVDENGELLSPMESIAKEINELDVSGFFKFGDGGPVETAWRQSSEFPFVLQLALSIMVPAEYFGVNIDTNKQIIDLIDNQEIFSDTGIRQTTTQLVQNEIDANGNVYRANSYLTWISEYCKSRGLDVTLTLGNRLRNLESKLGYKVGGYTDKKYLKVITEQYTPASNNPGVIIPDDDFDIVLNKSAPVYNLTYSGVIVTKTVDGYSVTGYDDNKPYFTIESSAINNNKNYIKVGKLAIIKYNDGTGQLYRVPYGTEFFSIDQVADFLVSYGRYLTRQGFLFTDKLDEDASWYLDWDLAVREFLFYVQQGWDVDVAISLSPIGSKVNYRSAFGTVDGLSNRPLNTRILDEDFKIVRASEYTVYRNGRDFNAKVDNSRGIYLIDMDVVEYEHVLIFNNITRFNDIIYDPVIGDRQHRLRLQGFKTADWDGTYSAAGFIINEDNVEEWRPGINYSKGEIVIFKGEYFTAGEKISASNEFELDYWIKTEYDSIKKGLLPNLANRAGLFKNFYNSNEVNLEQDSQKLGKNLIGFESRSYMEDLGISDTSQFKFYQGMLSQKGTNSSLDKLLKAKVDNFGGYANVYEEWAIRLGTYGATDSTRNLQIELDEAWAIKDPLVIELLDDNDPMPTGHKGLRSKDIYIKHIPYDKNFLNRRKVKKHPNDLYSAGYAQLSDVDYTAPTREALNSYVQDPDLGAGDLIWIAADRNNQWNVYRVDETDIRLESANIIANGNATIRCVNNHGLEKNDLIYITSDNTIPNVFGFFTVTTIVDARTFVVATGYGSVQIKPFSGFVYKLKSMRFGTVAEVAAQEPLKGWKPGDTLFVDVASNDGWRIYENNLAWNNGPNFRSNSSLAGDRLGQTIATDNQNYYMIAGRPSRNQGDVVIYSITSSGTLEETANLTTDSVGTSNLGHSVSASNDATFAAGAPNSDSDLGLVAIFGAGVETGNFRTQQVLTSETLDVGGEFGYSVKLSSDGNWLAVGQPGADEGYVHLYQRRVVSIIPAATVNFTGDGSTAIFVLTGDAANPNDTESVIVVVDGVTLTPTTDYTISVSDLILTAAPAAGSNISVTVNRGTPGQTFITDGVASSFTLTGDNSSPSSIYALYVEVDGVIQVPFRDYTLTLVGSQYSVDLTYTPVSNVEVAVAQRTHYELVTSFTSASASIGDRFGATLEFTDKGRQLIVGAPASTVDGVAGAGKAYVYERLAETFYADGVATDFETASTIEGRPYVYIDDILMVENVDYYTVVNTISFTVTPTVGSLIKIETNNFLPTVDFTLESANDDLEQNARFGESIVVCPTNCSVYISAPGKDNNNKINTGKVYRFINQGRFFGAIYGSVQNPTISTNSALIINDFIVGLASGSTLSDIITAINDTNIPGVKAYDVDGYLYIETNSQIIGNKLLLASALGQPLVDIGLEVYAYQQTINSPQDEHFVEFGKSLAIGPAADLLAIGSSKASTRIETTIDNKTTYFDSRATSFNDIKKQSGAVWLYQYLPTAGTSVDNPGQFILAQRLSNPLIDNLDEFGSSIAINNSTIYVGAPGDDTKNDLSTLLNTGIVFSYENSNQAKIWKTVRSEIAKVDIDLINRIFLYNKETNEIVADLDYIDPIKGKISGLAAQEITYQTSFDPAVYSNTSVGRLWGKDHVGQVWWDISQTRWINYEQSDVANRGINWNTAFPGSAIMCYEWIESDVPPTQFTDEKDTTAYARSNNFNLLSDIDPNTGIVTNKYYYWVAGKRTIPQIKNRRYSTVDIENLIANPRATGIPYIAFIDSNAVALFNCAGLLQDKNVVLNIDYDVKYNENSIHTEFQLLSENDANSIPNEKIVQKLIDSLAGADANGNLVPDIRLTLGEKYGIEYRPRQTIFRDRKQALKTAVSYINRVLAQIPVRDNKDTTNLLAYEEIPNVNLLEYNDTVNDNIELSYLNINLLPEGFKILVKVDNNVGDRWTIYKKVNNAWHLEKVQNFDNRRYIESIDWIKPEIQDPIVTDYTVDFGYQISSIIPTNGDTIKIRDAGNGKYAVLQYNNGQYELIKQESATYKITDSIWDESTFAQGFDRETFDVQIYDDWASVEIQNIMRAVYDDVFAGDNQIEKNRWFLLMMQHLLAEQKYVDWVFKTSFIKVEHRNQQAISQIPTLQKDRQDSLRKYIEEIKPYHTKIREFVTSHEGFDIYSGDTTDFDLPSYFNETTGKYRSPTGLDEIDDVILERPEYYSWVNNHTLEVESVIVHNTGDGYSTNPELTVIGTTGTGTKLESVVVNGQITNVNVLNPGAGYTTTPTIEIGPSSGIDAKLIPVMSNKKIRSIKDVMKLDRISNNGGFLVQFLDSYGEPIDIRNQRKSRLLGREGVIDELIDALTLDVNGYTHWIKENESLINWPVENAANYRIFNDTSGRIQVQYKKVPGGWTADLLQLYIRSLGIAVGVDELDISGTTVVFDGNMSIYSPTIMDWYANTRYDAGDIISYNGRAYTLNDGVQSLTTGDDFDVTDFREYTPDEFESHLNRTWTYYQPKAGSLGKDLGQLFAGIEYPGVKVQGPSFRAEPGYDVGNYDMSGLDQYNVGPEGVTVLDESILDQTLYSNFLDTSLGTRPEDLITFGGSFVDTYSSHAPEETIPGRVYDTLNIMVHTLSTNFVDANSGFSPQFNTNKFTGDGIKRRFKFRTSGQIHLGDYFLVYSNMYGPLYRKITETNFSLPGTITPGGFYEVAQTRTYSVDWVNEEIVFDNPIPAGDLLTIMNIGQIGENVIADDHYQADGVTAAYRFNISSSQLGGVLVLLNGIPTVNFDTQNIDGYPHVIFYAAPPAGSHIHLVATLNVDFAISYVNTQYDQVDNDKRYITLNRQIRYDRAKDTVMIVELNGRRLRPGNSTYHIGDGTTLTYALPMSADDAYGSLGTTAVEVWINGFKVDVSKYNITPFDGSTAPQLVFTIPPAEGDDISITYTVEAEYTYNEETRQVRVSNAIDIPDGSLLAVTAFSHHDAYKFKTKIFKGVDFATSVVPVSVGFGMDNFDLEAFDTTSLVTRAIGQSYTIDADQNNAEKVFISVDGETLIAGYDYNIQNGKISISDDIVVESDTIIVVTWMSANTYINATTFRVFKDLNDNYSYNRIAFADATTLARELKITDKEIYVTNGNVLGNPNIEKNIPGVIFIGSERIIFWKKTGNVLSQIRRGTAGTAATILYAKGSIAVDASNKSKVPNGELSTWYDLGDNAPATGKGLTLSNTIQARFLKESKGIIPFLSAIQIGGYILPGYVLDQYFS